MNIMKYFFSLIFSLLLLPQLDLFSADYNLKRVYGAYENKGRRDYMEDRSYLFNGDHSFFGVYDGHSGIQVADSVHKNLHNNIMQSIKKTASIRKGIFNGFLKTHEDLPKSLNDTGTCAVIALFKNNEIYVANAGDCRAVLACSGRAIDLSDDHKPDRPDEEARIKAAGGFVSHYGVWRTQGQLAVSRAIGDKYLNPFVIPEPEIEKHIISDENDEFLILACDGIWDVFSSQQAVDIVKKTLDDSEAHDPFTEAAEALVSEAFTKGSDDNLSVIVIDINYLRNKQPVALEPEQKVASAERRRSRQASIALSESLIRKFLRENDGEESQKKQGSVGDFERKISSEAVGRVDNEASSTPAGASSMPEESQNNGNEERIVGSEINPLIFCLALGLGCYSLYELGKYFGFFKVNN